MSEDEIQALHAVTSATSLILMRGQLAYLRTVGLRAAALCGPGPEVEQVRTRESVPVFTIPMEREIRPRQDLLSFWQVWRLLRRVRPAVCNAGTPKAGLLVGVAAWLARVPCRVYTLHGLRLETATGVKRAVLRLTERIACACAQRVICVSPSLRQRALDLGLVRSNKCVVLGHGSANGVDSVRFAVTPEGLAAAGRIRRQHGIESTAPVIGFVGRLTRDKGVPELLEAFRLVRERIPDAVLLVIGSYESGDPVSPETVAGIENGPGVVRIAFVEDMTPYYLLMDMLALPTHREGLPTTVLEAQSAERPVVTTYATGAVDSVSPDVTGLLVPVGDARALADASIRLLSDRGLAQRMGRAGRERVCREFRQETMWASLAGLYAELLRGEL
jgi:glycosyltransferase involved in cell wall biosynthesis